MSTVYDTQTLVPGTATSRLRVVLLLDVLDGHEQKFLAAYDQIRLQVADVDGHISDQLCQSLGNGSQWLITSEWESAEPFLQWVESEAHRTLVEPLHVCVSETRSLRFLIARETPEAGATASRNTVPAPAARSLGKRVVRECERSAGGGGERAKTIGIRA